MRGKKHFELGAVVVRVLIADGECHIEDWAAAEAAQALDYAKETATCSDVAHVVFENCISGIRQKFTH